MKITRLAAFCAYALTLVISITANAALIDRGGGLIYDTDLNITWIADANLAASDTFNVTTIAQDAPFGTYGIRPDGTMTWDTAQGWIGAMNTANYLGYNDWRLPTTLIPDASCYFNNYHTNDSTGFNCNGSEMGHLFYNELGGEAPNGIGTTHNANYNLFSNVQPLYYWSGTEYASFYPSGAWDFAFFNGYQDFQSYVAGFYALAVRPGDVTAAPVPAAAWLFGSGLLGLIGMGRRRKAA